MRLATDTEAFKREREREGGRERERERERVAQLVEHLPVSSMLLV